ncbi:hypothetical protein U1Q18_019805 [Sarracenia purpurea var. burkii]
MSASGHSVVASVSFICIDGAHDLSPSSLLFGDEGFFFSDGNPERPTFVGICKKGSVEQYSAAPYLATLINCGLWLLYGLPMVHPHSFLVITINGSGIAIELAYLIIFLRYSDRRKRLRVVLLLLLELLVIGVVALLALTLAHTTKLRSTIIGSTAMVGNVIMYAAPLSVMVRQLSTPIIYII